MEVFLAVGDTAGLFFDVHVFKQALSEQVGIIRADVLTVLAPRADHAVFDLCRNLLCEALYFLFELLADLVAVDEPLIFFLSDEPVVLINNLLLHSVPFCRSYSGLCNAPQLKGATTPQGRNPCS